MLDFPNKPGYQQLVNLNLDDHLPIWMEASNLLVDMTQGRYDVEPMRGHRWMDPWYVRMSPSENIFVLLKHAFKQFQFIQHGKRANIGNLVCVM